MDIVLKILLIYLAVISLAAVCITVYDKIAAKIRPHSRIPEATLMLVGALGGACAMLVTMFVIRHKTQHAKFMLGLPAIILVQFVCVFAVMKLFSV